MLAIAEQLPERFIGSWQVQELGGAWGNMVDKRQEPCSKSDADMVITSDKAIDIDNNRPCKITSVKWC